MASTLPHAPKLARRGEERAGFLVSLQRRWSSWRLGGLCLLLVLALAVGLRLYNLVPAERGLIYAADADEGIYAASARLALDGWLPYRDYFCSAPPGALYMFMAILAPTSKPWGNESGFMALRYTSVAYGFITILAVYAVGRRLGGLWPGLLAAALLAIDGWAVAQDRRAMLEAPMNMFSVLAVLTLLAAAEKRAAGRWYALAGVLAGLATLAKTQGAVIVLALVLALALQRRWRASGLVVLGAVGTYLVLSLPFLATASDDMVRQLFFFQFLRPPNGDPAIMLRVNAIRSFPESWLTVRLGLLGALVLVVRWLWSAVARLMSSPPAVTNRTWARIDRSTEGAQPPDDSTDGGSLRAHSTAAGGWLVVALWAGLVALSFTASKSFYLYYYAQLAVPLALLGGGLLRPWPGRMPAGRVATALVLLALVGALLWRLPAQAQATLQGTQYVKWAYRDLGRFLAAQTPASSTVLTFEPNYTFLGSRPNARLSDGKHFVDSHAHMLYLSLDIEEQSWSSLWRALARREPQDEQQMAWQQPVQEEVLGAFGRSDYVIVDRRARYLLSPATLRTIERQSVEVVTLADITLRKRTGGVP